MFEEIVKSCFLVKVRKAKGRSSAGGMRTGRTDDFPCRVFGLLPVRTGRAGVPKAGEDDGMISAPRIGSGILGVCILSILSNITTRQIAEATTSRVSLFSCELQGCATGNKRYHRVNPSILIRNQ